MISNYQRYDNSFEPRLSKISLVLIIIAKIRTMGYTGHWKCGESHPWKRGESVQFFNEAEHLQANGWHDNQQAGSEHHQAAKLLPRTKYLVHKVFQRRWNLDKPDYSKNLVMEKKAYMPEKEF